MNRFTTICLVATGMVAIAYPSVRAQGTYDGDYAGVGTLTTDKASIRQGDSCSNTEHFDVHVRTGQVSMTHQVHAETVTVAGTVGGDGSVSAFGSSRYGGVNLKGKINGADFTGSSASISCAYAFTLHRR
jgi:hypothetical protein